MAERMSDAQKQAAYRARSAELRARDEVQAMQGRQVQYMLERLQRQGVGQVTLQLADMVVLDDAGATLENIAKALLKEWSDSQRGEAKGTAVAGRSHSAARPPRKVQETVSPNGVEPATVKAKRNRAK